MDLGSRPSSRLLSAWSFKKTTARWASKSSAPSVHAQFGTRYFSMKALIPMEFSHFAMSRPSLSQERNCAPPPGTRITDVFVRPGWPRGTTKGTRAGVVTFVTCHPNCL